MQPQEVLKTSLRRLLYVMDIAKMSQRRSVFTGSQQIFLDQPVLSVWF